LAAVVGFVDSILLVSGYQCGMSTVMNLEKDDLRIVTDFCLTILAAGNEAWKSKIAISEDSNW
jgi:hypothetical protein